MAAAGRSANTIRLHRHYYDQLSTLATTPASVTTDQLAHWLGRNRHWKPETRKSAQGVARSFYRWATRAGIVTERVTGRPARTGEGPRRGPRPDT